MSEAAGPLGAAGHNVRRNIRRLREEHRWSYRDVEERLLRAGRVIPALAQSAIDAGQRHVDVDDLVALAMVFDVDVDDLLRPPAACRTCHGAPPHGFMCMECETSALPTA
ncbi:helix-turn-helix domain-containing protein [Streptomyces bobili]|uniref:helix-turn-helix domain-containing protein n=1 Tax=Streptomyces bobili TaxID=67280 RepID=UPI002257544C|nr:helix-turn-helix transcriptional regulator [Streptomyces bobili]MCX5522217.1 helix-turn-helix domain-containing protein [Streptomyces bobili]